MEGGNEVRQRKGVKEEERRKRKVRGRRGRWKKKEENKGIREEEMEGGNEVRQRK